MEKDFYEITKNTYALIGKDKQTTEIIERNKRFIINNSVINILKESCEYYGSTLDGRIRGSKKLLGMCYKLPVIIEGSNEIIFFPTSSPTKEDCCWIASNHIASYKAVDNNTCITFTDGQAETFALSYEAFENQIFRSTKLLFQLRNRKNLQK